MVRIDQQPLLTDLGLNWKLANPLTDDSLRQQCCIKVKLTFSPDRARFLPQINLRPNEPKSGEFGNGATISDQLLTKGNLT